MPTSSIAVLGHFAVNNELGTIGRSSSGWTGRLAYLLTWLSEKLHHSKETSLQGYVHVVTNMEISLELVYWLVY